MHSKGYDQGNTVRYISEYLDTIAHLDAQGAAQYLHKYAEGEKQASADTKKKKTLGVYEPLSRLKDKDHM